MKRPLFTRALSLLLILAFLPTLVLADNWYLEYGDITVSATDDGNGGTTQTVSQGEVTKEDDAPTISTWDPDGEDAGSSESTNNTITISADAGTTAEVTLDDVNIDVSNKGEAAISTSGAGDVTLTLSGENEVSSGSGHAGVEKGNGGELTITAPVPEQGEEPGSLEANGGYAAAGIGGGNGQSVSNITITGDAQVDATGGYDGAGIGGGCNGSGSNITIDDNAHVNAAAGVGDRGDGGGAGIGGGECSEGSNISIKGNAQVDATGGWRSAGIGGGYERDGSNITIDGNAQVDAAGGWGGAGIGGGYRGSGSVTIGGNAQVDAAGGKYGAGIGGGNNPTGSQNNTVTIRENAQVRVRAGIYASYIGSGCGKNFGDKDELTPDTVANGLVNGWIAYYDSDKNMEQDTPQKVVYRGTDGKLKEISGDNITITSRVPPTCTADGSITFTADGKEFTARVKATGHNWGGYTVDTSATCTHPGSESRHCTNCEATTDEREIAQLAHAWKDTYTVDQAATCTTPGSESRHCANCEAITDSRDIAKLAHVFNSYSYNKDATCTQDGTETAACDYGCGQTDKRTKAGTMLAHVFTDYSYNNDATCTQDGTETASCDYGCGHTDKRTKAGTALGHLFETYVYNQDATTQRNGTETAHCAHPGCTATDTREALGTMREALTPAALLPYWVQGPDGKALTAQEELENGVLTITVPADTASLMGTIASLYLLEGRGVTEIRFVTNSAESSFLLADLLAYETGSFTLTHTGAEVSFTLDGADIREILK